MRILLPPSENKFLGGSVPWDPSSGSFPLESQRRTIIDAIIKSPPHGVVTPGDRARPAYERYTGVVWMHLGVEDLPVDAAKRAEDRIVIASALGGLFAWGDPTPYYKLKMSASTPRTGRLAKFWAGHLPQLLAGTPVIDLLALEQSAAVPVPVGNHPWWRVELVGPDGQRSGHHGKAAKGRLARQLCMTDDPFGLLEEYRDGDGWVLRITRSRG